MPTYHPIRLRTGGILQAGIPKEAATPPGPNHGLVRGVVVATYCVDDPQHPLALAGVTPTSVYCDVLAYSSAAGGSRFFFLPGAAVAQPLGGLHKGTVYKPRAATRLLSGKPLSDVSPQDVGDMDGDHVLVALADGRSNQPVILAALPHPSRDVGNPADLPAGPRQQLRLADGDPMFCLHHGSVFGLDDQGNFLVDTSRANQGALGPDGAELPGAAGSGGATWNLAAAACRTTNLKNPSLPEAARTVLAETLSAEGYRLNTGALGVAWQVLSNAGNGLQLAGAGAAASLKVGDGAVHAAVAEQLAAWWTQVSFYLSSHVHNFPAAPTGAPTSPPLTAPPGYSPAITSKHLSFPAG